MEWLFSDGGAYFAVPAIIGTLVFALQLTMMLIGGVTDFNLDVDLDHADPSQVFKVLSIQSAAAFMMGFGWAGVAGFKGMDWGLAPSIGVGMIGGVGMVWILGLLIRAVAGLQSTGNLRLEDAVGLEGEVYIAVPPRGEGSGRLNVTIGNRQRILRAVTDGERINAKGRARVVKLNEDNSVTVIPV